MICILFILQCLKHKHLEPLIFNFQGPIAATEKAKIHARGRVSSICNFGSSSISNILLLESARNRQNKHKSLTHMS